MHINLFQSPQKLLSLAILTIAGTDRFRVDIEVLCARPCQTVDEHAVVAAVAVTGADCSHHQRRCGALRHAEILVALATKCVTSLKHIGKTLCTCTCISGLRSELVYRWVKLRDVVVDVLHNHPQGGSSAAHVGRRRERLHLEADLAVTLLVVQPTVDADLTCKRTSVASF